LSTEQHEQEQGYAPDAYVVGPAEHGPARAASKNVDTSPWDDVSDPGKWDQDVVNELGRCCSLHHPMPRLHSALRHTLTCRYRLNPFGHPPPCLQLDAGPDIVRGQELMVSHLRKQQNATGAPSNTHKHGKQQAGTESKLGKPDKNSKGMKRSLPSVSDFFGAAKRAANLRTGSAAAAAVVTGAATGEPAPQRRRTDVGASVSASASASGSIREVAVAVAGPVAASTGPSFSGYEQCHTCAEQFVDSPPMWCEGCIYTEPICAHCSSTVHASFTTGADQHDVSKDGGGGRGHNPQHVCQVCCRVLADQVRCALPMLQSLRAGSSQSHTDALTQSCPLSQTQPTVLHRVLVPAVHVQRVQYKRAQNRGWA